jgi:cyclase
VADATFDKTWSQTFGDETVTGLYNGPGHTGGDAIVHFERAHVVHMGDLLFHERHPRVDRPAGASIQNWITILEGVGKEMPADTIYVAGHAKDGLPVTADRKALMRFRDYFDAVLSLVRKGIAKGDSKDAIVATAALPGFETFQNAPPALTLAGVLGVAYDELTAR